MEQWLIEYLVNALWQLPLLAAAAWLLLRLVRPAPQVQHWVWLAVLGLALLVPTHGMGTPEHAPGRDVVAAPIASNGAGWSGVQTQRVRLGATTTHWLVTLYVATMILGLFRIARAWRSARNLAENSQQICLSHFHTAALNDCGRRLGVKLPQLRESTEVSSPMIIGALAPILLLPKTFTGLAENEVRAALCHELAHVKRRDYLLNVMCELAALPMVWHPVMQEVQQRIRVTREMVCDAMAAQEMESEIGYAKCLLALANSMLGVQPHFPGLFSKNTLEERVMRLTETTTTRVRCRVVRAAAGVAVMMAVGAVTAVLHVTPTMAQAKASDPVPAVQNAPAPAVQTASPTSALAVTHHGKAHTAHAHSAGKRQHQQLRPAEQHRVQQQIADAQQQMAKAAAMINSAEFQKRMDDARRQVAEATARLNSQEFKQQMDEAQRRIAETTKMLSSQKFKTQMEEAQRQITKATEMVNSPEFKKQMDELNRKMKEAFSGKGVDPTQM